MARGGVEPQTFPFSVGPLGGSYKQALEKYKQALEKSEQKGRLFRAYPALPDERVRAADSGKAGAAHARLDRPSAARVASGAVAISNQLRLLRPTGGVDEGSHRAPRLFERREGDGVVAVAGLRFEVEKGLQMAGESGVDAGEQVNGTPMIIALMVSAEASAADDVARRDSGMNGQGCACIGDVAWFIRELEDSRVCLCELLGLPPSPTDHGGSACASTRSHVYLLLPRPEPLSAETSH